jgi:hypothetical protein
LTKDRERRFDGAMHWRIWTRPALLRFAVLGGTDFTCGLRVRRLNKACDVAAAQVPRKKPGRNGRAFL